MMNKIIKFLKILVIVTFILSLINGISLISLEYLHKHYEHFFYTELYDFACYSFIAELGLIPLFILSTIVLFIFCLTEIMIKFFNEKE